MNNLRNIRVGLAVNSPDNHLTSAIGQQYIKNDEFFNRISNILEKYNAEAINNSSVII